MQLETVSKVKGWIAVLSLPAFMLAFAGLGLGQSASWQPWVMLVSFVAGPVCAVSWIRQRRRMREMEYQGRMLRKGLS